ncbi:hypothetical protein ACOZ82_001954 [Vibrio parahaemolyticus]
MYKCPTCKGQRQSIAFVNTGIDSSKHYSEVQTCERCLGAGYVSKDILDAIERGKQLRHERIDKGYTLRDAAKAEGVSVSIISKRELGY